MAQNSASANRLSALFDNLILKDTIYKVAKLNKLPVLDPATVNNTGINDASIYDLNKEKVKGILDSKSYSEQEKIAFIKKVVSDTLKDGFWTVHKIAIDFWQTSAEARKLMDYYYTHKREENTVSELGSYEYMEFKCINFYPESYQLIRDYFECRNELSEKFHQEGVFIYTLIKLNKEKEAVNYLEILVDDLIKGSIRYIDEGSHLYYPKDDNIFYALCLSENEEVSKKAIEILFKLLETKGGHDELASYLDNERYVKTIESRFNHAASIDLSQFTPKEIDSKKWGELTQAENDALDYTGSIDYYSKILGAKMGKRCWHEFIRARPFLENKEYRNAEGTQLSVLENVFKDKTLSQDDLRTMLLQMKLYDTYYKDNYNSKRFIKLITIAYPNLIVSKEEFARFGLDKIMPYSSPLNVASYLKDPYSYIYGSRRIKAEDINKLLGEVNQFSSDNNLKTMELNRRHTFYLSSATIDAFIYNFLNQNKLLVSFGGEGSDVPTNYIDLFETEFKAVLENKGITDIKILQSTEKLEEDLYHYIVIIQSNESIYKYEYTEEGTDWYNPQRLVKMLNFCLRDKKTDVRFVGIVYDDPFFILMNPGIAKTFLKQYSIDTYAIEYDDAFRTSD